MASVLTGSIGLPGSALLGTSRLGMSEPGHGTTLDIAGQDLANPLACIRAAGLVVRHSLDWPDLDNRIENAVTQVLSVGFSTREMRGCGSTVGTEAIGAAVVEALRF